MKFFQDSSIGVKVLIPPAVLILALGIVSLLAIYGLNEQRTVLDQVHNIALEKITLVDEFILLSERVQSDVFHISVLRFMDLPAEKTQPIYQRLEQGLSDLDVIYGQILVKWPLDEMERSLLERMKDPMDDFRLQALEAAAVVSDNPSFGILLVRSSTVPFVEFRKTLTEFLDYQRVKIVRAEAESYQKATMISTTIVVIASLIALTGIFATLLISTRLISHPIRAITDLMRRLADGELSIEVGGLERRDEIGEMAQAVEVFRHNAIERARLNEALQENEALLGNIVESMSDGILVLDTNFHCTYWNRAMETISKVPREELVGTEKYLWEVFPYMSEQGVDEMMRRAMRGEIARQKDIPYHLPDGTRGVASEIYLPLRNAAGEIDGVVGVIHDITERKQAEDALRELNATLEAQVVERTAELEAQYARLDAILRSTSDGIVVADADGEILQANPVAQTWLDQALSPEEGSQLRDAVRDIATRREPRSVELLELTGLDLELGGAPILEPGLGTMAQPSQGNPKTVVAIHDVSHFRALDRMKTRFITNISHELRTPVTTIKLYAYLMQQQPEKWQEHIDVLAQEADRQAQLVDDVLQISRIDAGRLEMRPRPIPLDELTDAIVINRQVLAQDQGVTLEHRSAGPSPVAMVDSERMKQALNNLVENAIRYTPQGGDVVVSIGTQEAEERTWATVTVADTGMGIPEDELPHVFDRFFRGEEPRTMQLMGTGLGLSIVKEIVELHGGRVTVESEVSVGSTFTVWLPLIG